MESIAWVVVEVVINPKDKEKGACHHPWVYREIKGAICKLLKDPFGLNRSDWWNQRCQDSCQDTKDSILPDVIISQDLSIYCHIDLLIWVSRDRNPEYTAYHYPDSSAHLQSDFLLEYEIPKHWVEDYWCTHASIYDTRVYACFLRKFSDYDGQPYINEPIQGPCGLMHQVLVTAQLGN